MLPPQKSHFISGVCRTNTAGVDSLAPFHSFPFIYFISCALFFCCCFCYIYYKSRVFHSIYNIIISRFFLYARSLLLFYFFNAISLFYMSLMYTIFFKLSFFASAFISILLHDANASARTNKRKKNLCIKSNLFFNRIFYSEWMFFSCCVDALHASLINNEMHIFCSQIKLQFADEK